MKIILTHEFSELDNKNCFGLYFDGEDENHQIYIRWIWFYMGLFLQDIKHAPYPYKVGKVVKRYKNCHDAEKQAKFIVNKIAKIVNDYNLKLLK